MNRSPIRIAGALLLFGAIAVLSFRPAFAFIRISGQTSPTSPVVQAHWLDSELPLKSVIDPTNNDVPPADALAAIEAAAQTWQDVNTSYFTINAHPFAGAPDVQPALAFDGQNSVIFLDDETGTVFAPGVIEFVRTVFESDTGHTLDADMVFNDRDFFASVSTPDLTPAPPGQFSVDLQSVVTHEYGHYLGLDHTSITGATMIPFVGPDISMRTIELDDRAGVSTIYPESASRPGGLSPGAVDFAASTGTVSGTVVSGFDGSPIFGAHVEAFLLTAPTPDHQVSAISGELTLRNGMGDFTIHGLPPGPYAIAIVPLDGVHTTASDANIGGVYNGLDINFEPEFWNGAGEGGNGFTDLANDFAPVNVSPGANTGGVNFITNTFPGRVVMAQYGEFENIVTFVNTGFLAVRFDPPFDAPFTISSVEFPSFTFDGGPAVFPSARLCRLDKTTGLPDIAHPIGQIAPFVGSPSGVNVVPLNFPIRRDDRTLFWVLEFPAAGANFPNQFPFLFMDFVQMEKGSFANTYSVPLGNINAGILLDRNLIVSMTCQMSSPRATPISAPSSLGGNRIDRAIDFSYQLPGDVRADGFAMPPRSLDHVELLVRKPGPPGTYQTVGFGSPRADHIKLERAPSPANALIWSVQAVDQNCHNSLQSNVTVTGLAEDTDEPNGRRADATLLPMPTVNRVETYSPAGDQDFYRLFAKPGDVIDISATHVGANDGFNDPDYVMFLYDGDGNIVAYNDDFNGLDPRVVYKVPPATTAFGSKIPRRFAVQITDYYGSLLNPTGAPRIPTPLAYAVNASVTTPPNATTPSTDALNPNQYQFVNSGPNPANPLSKFLYIIPMNQGPQNVRLRIYDVSGRLVRTLVDASRTPGPYTAVWDGRDDHSRSVASGNYFARMEIGAGFIKNMQVTVLK